MVRYTEHAHTSALPLRTIGHIGQYDALPELNTLVLPHHNHQHFRWRARPISDFFLVGVKKTPAVGEQVFGIRHLCFVADVGNSLSAFLATCFTCAAPVQHHAAFYFVIWTAAAILRSKHFAAEA